MRVDVRLLEQRLVDRELDLVRLVVDQRERAQRSALDAELLSQELLIAQAQVRLAREPEQFRQYFGVLRIALLPRRDEEHAMLFVLRT